MSTTMPPQQVTLSTALPGDILFFRAGAGNAFADKAIAAWEGSKNPFIHVAIAISALQKIEALSPTVVLTPINSRLVGASYQYSGHASPFNAASLHTAIVWLQSMVGSLYGWGDIAEAVLYKFEQGISVGEPGHYDCSALATEFLIRAGGVAAIEHLDPHTVTPQALAEALGVK